MINLWLTHGLTITGPSALNEFIRNPRFNTYLVRTRNFAKMLKQNSVGKEVKTGVF